MNIISIITSPKIIIHNNKTLEFDFDIPAVFPSNFFCLYWWEHEQKFEYWTMEEDGKKVHTLDGSEDSFNLYVSPFIAQFNAYTPSEKEIRKQLTDAVQLHLDDTVAKRGYDNIHTACTYFNSTDEVFAAEGKACVAWRDSVWRKCYDLLAEVMAGTRDIPTEEELLAELPVLEW